MVNGKKGEFMAFNTWTDPDVLDELDKLERFAVRSYFKMRLPNAYIIAELHLSSRVWRQEVLYLASFIRRLGSKDSRVQLTALMMSRDAPQPSFLGPSSELLSPRFFGWTGTFPAAYSGPSATDVTSIPERIAYLARRFEIGLWEDGVQLHVTYKGVLFQNPHNILQTLSRRRDKEMLELLECRQSTDLRKTRAPPFAINWGSAGRPTAHRNEESAFLDAHSPYSDSEIFILSTLRLLVWPTALRSAIRAGGHGWPSGRCPTCMISVQTATHLLNVPSGDRSHCNTLRNLPQSRHTAAVQCLVTALAASTWKIIAAEGHRRASDATLDRYLDAINAAVGQQILDSGDGAQHYKPDAILLDPVTKEIYIVDVHFGSDDKLDSEDALLTHLKETLPSMVPNTVYGMTRAYSSPQEATRAMNRRAHTHLAPFTTVYFDSEGAMTPRGQTKFQIDTVVDTEVRAGILNVTTFSQARYARRYAPLVGVLRRAGNAPVRQSRRNLSPPVHLLVIAVGVTGTIPRFTVRNLNVLFPKKGEAKKIRLDLRHRAWRAAALAYPAWRAEENRV
jgi:hypothetical protein